MADTTYFGNKNLAAIATIFATAIVLTGSITAASYVFTAGNYNARALLFAGDTGVVTSTPNLTYTTTTDTLHVKNANCSGTCTGFGISTTSTLQQVTDAGATTTNEVYLYGGASTTGFVDNGTAVVKGHAALGANSALNDGSLLFPANSFYNLLSAEETITTTTPDYIEGLTSYLLYDPSTSTLSQEFGVDGEVFSKPNNPQDITVMEGGYFQSSHFGTGEVQYGGGLQGITYNAATGTIDFAPGVAGSVYNLDQGLITDAPDFYAGSGDNSGGGTITNRYGLLVDDLRNLGNNTWAIYSAGGDVTLANSTLTQTGLATFSDTLTKDTSEESRPFTLSYNFAGPNLTVRKVAQTINLNASSTQSTSIYAGNETNVLLDGTDAQEIDGNVVNVDSNVGSSQSTIDLANGSQVFVFGEPNSTTTQMNGLDIWMAPQANDNSSLSTVLSANIHVEDIGLGGTDLGNSQAQETAGIYIEDPCRYDACTPTEDFVTSTYAIHALGGKNLFENSLTMFTSPSGSYDGFTDEATGTQIGFEYKQNPVKGSSLTDSIGVLFDLSGTSTISFPSDGIEHIVNGFMVTNPSFDIGNGNVISVAATQHIAGLPDSQLPSGEINNHVGLLIDGPQVQMNDTVAQNMNEWIVPTGASSSGGEIQDLISLNIGNDANNLVTSSSVVGNVGTLVDDITGIHLAQLLYSSPKPVGTQSTTTVAFAAGLLIDGPPTSTNNNILWGEQHALEIASGDSMFLGTITMPNLVAPSITDNVVCVDTATGRLKAQATNCVVSSARFKEHIESLSSEDLLKETLALRAVSFDWKDGHTPGEGTNGGSRVSTGFIAEEVAKIDPQLVSYTSDYTAEDLAFEEKNYPEVILHKDGKTFIPQTVDYARMSYVLSGAIQAQEKRLDNVQAQIDALSHKTSLLEKIVNLIKKILHLK